MRTIPTKLDELCRLTTYSFRDPEDGGEIDAGGENIMTYHIEVGEGWLSGEVLLNWADDPHDDNKVLFVRWKHVMGGTTYMHLDELAARMALLAGCKDVEVPPRRASEEESFPLVLRSWRLRERIRVGTMVEYREGEVQGAPVFQAGFGDLIMATLAVPKRIVMNGSEPEYDTDTYFVFMPRVAKAEYPFGIAIAGYHISKCCITPIMVDNPDCPLTREEVYRLMGEAGSIHKN